MNDKRLNKVTEAILRKFPEASTEEVREFAMALIDYGKQVKRRSKWKPLKGKEIKILLGKGGDKW